LLKHVSQCLVPVPPLVRLSSLLSQTKQTGPLYQINQPQQTDQQHQISHLQQTHPRNQTKMQHPFQLNQHHHHLRLNLHLHPHPPPISPNPTLCSTSAPPAPNPTFACPLPSRNSARSSASPPTSRSDPASLDGGPRCMPRQPTMSRVT
jgi:hypothetical protein